MAQPAQPVRVIYAKLTSTGDYDVVAKTDNIDLNAARSLAEKLLLGNVPHDASIDEELAYLQPADGGHIFIRYTTYNWKDEHRGGAFMTDIVWLNDADFARARNNPFAVMPASDDVYDVLTVLPPVVVSGRTAAQDMARIAELSEARGAAMGLAAVALRGETLLWIDRADRRRRVELFTLALPPKLRPLVTFQTRAFRVPAFPPRITLSDAMHANLQGGPWAHVLPDVSLDVALGLANTLIDALDKPKALATAQELYDRSAGSGSNLRAEATRFVGLIAFAEALETNDLTAAFRLAASGPAAEVEARLMEVSRRASPADTRAAILASMDNGGEGETLALHLLAAVAKTDAKAAAALHDEVARRLIAQSRMPGSALATQLIGSLAASKNADALVLLLGLDPRAATSLAPADMPASPHADFLRALSDAAKSRRDIASAAHVAAATAALMPMVSEPAAVSKLAMLCREAVEASLDKATLDARDITAIERLHAAAEPLLASPAMRNAVPQIFADRQLEGMTAAQAHDAAVARAERLHPDAQAALAAALIVRSADPAGGGVRDARLAAARGLLTTLQPPMRARVQRVLEELGLGADALLGLRGGEELLPLLGRSTEQAASTRDLLQAVRELGDRDDAIAQLAIAVLAARNGHLMLVRTHQAYAPLKTALSESMTKRRAAGTHAGVLELTLDLLATITDADAFAELETAALANGGVTVRLRRLDRAVALCRAAEDEVAYEQLALAIESPDTQITDATRRRLRDALGTGGLQRRLIQMITGVVERGAQ